VEIYKEVVTDMLSPLPPATSAGGLGHYNHTSSGDRGPDKVRRGLHVREHADYGFFVQGR
jgi:hypothetical protein